MKIKQKLKAFFDARVPAGKFLYRCAARLRAEISSVPAILRCIFARIFSPEKTLLVCGWILKGGEVANNWGDDLNVLFFSESTGKRVLVYPGTRLARLVGLKHFVLIGSVIHGAVQKNSIVWGSGLINDKRGFKICARPRKILAVRGPLTREWLLAQGVECPAVYGDPALLLPQFYTPKKLARSRVGLIPHHLNIEHGNENVRHLLAESSEVRLIRIQGYKNWRDVIDRICSCDCVISESLHGLIVAESYGVPALWVEFSEHVPGWDFKFRDFYASIGKPDVAASVRVSEKTTLGALTEKVSAWRAGTIDTAALLATCPFALHKVPTEAGAASASPASSEQMGGGHALVPVAFSRSATNLILFSGRKSSSKKFSSAGFFRVPAKRAA